MKIFIVTSFVMCLITIIFPIQIFADTALDVYMNDFYSKSNEASQILKEIENSFCLKISNKLSLRIYFVFFNFIISPSSGGNHPNITRN